ncbi:MAG: EpsG family protein [Methyloprofundus sp.]|nr:EpsG family protein [Methyloprofundus sp.]
MATVFFYNFILFSSTFFVWLSEKGRTKLDRWVLLGIAFLLVFVPAAIRYDIGTDYLNYLAIYEGTSAIKTLEPYKFKEPLFYFVNWFLKSIDAHFQWMFAAFAFIFTAAAFKAYPRKNAWLLHFLFFSMLLFFSFNGLRQAVALSLSFLALFHFFERRYFWFFALNIVGATFHQSALFITATGLAALIPLGIHLKTRIAPFVFIGFIGFTYISMSVVLVYLEQILNLVGLTKYAGYFSSTRHFIPRDFGSGLGVLAKLLFSIYIILNAKALIELNKNYWLLIILTFAYALGIVLANNIVIFGRMADTFILAPVIGAFLLFHLPKNKQFHRLVLTVFLLFLILSFSKEGIGTETSYADPKRNPYQTIFSE